MNASKARSKSRVFIVDDHPLIRKTVLGLLAQMMNLIPCGEAETFEGGLGRSPCPSRTLS